VDSKRRVRGFKSGNVGLQEPRPCYSRVRTSSQREGRGHHGRGSANPVRMNQRIKVKCRNVKRKLKSKEVAYLRGEIVGGK